SAGAPGRWLDGAAVAGGLGNAVEHIADGGIRGSVLLAVFEECVRGLAADVEAGWEKQRSVWPERTGHGGGRFTDGFCTPFVAVAVDKWLLLRFWRGEPVAHGGEL